MRAADCRSLSLCRRRRSWRGCRGGWGGRAGVLVASGCDGVELNSAAGDRGRPPCRHVVAVLSKLHDHCINGQADAPNQRIPDALSTPEAEQDPGYEGGADSLKWQVSS
jgi:hypothetical protein